MESSSPSFDWIALWKLYHRYFFWICFLCGVPLRLFVAHKLRTPSTKKAWALSTVASAPLILLIPFTALPGAIFTAFLPGGGTLKYSLLLSLPIALSSGAVNTLVDWLLLRFVMRARIGRRGLLLVYAADVLNVLLATAAVLIWAWISPPHVFA